MYSAWHQEVKNLTELFCILSTTPLSFIQVTIIQLSNTLKVEKTVYLKK